MRLMFGLGNLSPDMSPFNLNIGCISQLDFFRSCRVPNTIPEFASQSLLSRPCNASVSWEKVMLKLDEAFQVETLSDEATMRATLACRILILIEAEETKASVLRVGERGRQLLNEVLPCSLKAPKVWPATSMAFYVIFSWIRRTGMVDQATDQFIDSNESKMVTATGYRMISVKLATPDTIEVQLRPQKGACKHVFNATSSFDFSSASFPMAVTCRECDPNEQNIRSVDLAITPLLVRVMFLMKMTTVYLQHNHQGDLHRESLMACFLHVLQNGTAEKVKEFPWDRVNGIYEKEMPVAREKQPGTVLPPLKACDYRTTEGQQRKRKRKGKTYVDIPRPSEKQTIAMFVSNVKLCEGEHSKAPLSKFRGERDKVISDLMSRNIQSLEVTMDMIPDQMEAINDSASSSMTALSKSNEAVGLKRKTLASLDSDDEHMDSLHTRQGSSSFSTSTSKGTVGFEQKTMAVLDSGDEDELGNSCFPGLGSSCFAASTSNGAVGQKGKTMARPDSEDENEPRDTHHPKRKSPQSKPVTGTLNASSSSSFAKPFNSTKRKRIVTMIDSDGDDEDEKVETLPSSLRPPHDKPTSQPTLSQRAIPIAAATTSQRTDKLVLQHGTSEANRESHETETDNDTQDEQYSDSSSDSESDSESEEGQERETQYRTSPLNTPLRVLESTSATTVSMPVVPSPPSTIELPVVELLSSEQNDDTPFDDAEFLRVAMGSPVTLDPLPSEMITHGQQQVEYQDKKIVGPVTQEIGRRGKCLVRLLREVGDVGEVVPHVDMVLSANGEFTFSVNATIRQLYSLWTVPIEWTRLKDCDKIIRTLFMVAGLQALDPQLNRFVVDENYKMAWYPPLAGPFQLQDHPLEVLQWEPKIASRLRAAVRADASFGQWVKDITEKIPLIDAIVRDAGLHTGEGSGVIDIHYFAGFFDHLKRVLPWIENQ